MRFIKIKYNLFLCKFSYLILFIYKQNRKKTCQKLRKKITENNLKFNAF